jgi:hypothetical protein
MIVAPVPAAAVIPTAPAIKSRRHDDPAVAVRNTRAIDIAMIIGSAAASG